LTPNNPEWKAGEETPLLRRLVVLRDKYQAELDRTIAEAETNIKGLIDLMKVHTEKQDG